ncbi:MAG: ferredoxin-type protein NapF [Campylobacterota bacterium]|nr:ferredoxin-type protein NapF [Campylobacterota bacterium]
MSELSRRGFFGALGTKTVGKEIKIRPPYATDETLFGTACPECDGVCATLCEEEIIKIGKDKIPYLDFSKSGCTYCEECIDACEPNVLHDINAPIQATIRIYESKCMSWQSVMCFSCKEPCLDDAIIFDGLFKPVIDVEKCTACGFCLDKCPSNAIEIVA